MKYTQPKIIYVLTTVTLLTGCFNGVSSHHPLTAVQVYNNIEGAFINGDYLYLIGTERDYELPKAPFLEYKKLADSHLKNDIACYTLSSTLYLTKKQKNIFEGTYRVLLRSHNVTSYDIKTYNLQPLSIDTTEYVAENKIWSNFLAQDCGLKTVKKELFYIAEFSATGRSLYLSNRAEALEKAKLQQMMTMEMFIIRDANKPKSQQRLTETMEIAVKAPMYILGIMFAR